MRTARLVGPTADGTSVVLVTDDGEQLSVPIDPEDPATRSALEQVRDRLGPAPTTTGPPDAAGPDPSGRTPAPARRPPRRRETNPMDTPLSPRDIQHRIRAGESLEDVAAGSGLDADRIERFAAPVLAEREHMALTALSGSVRRRGESSGHRPLRTVVAERLLGQGVDADEVVWDAWKRDDGQWQVSADYELREQDRHAEFRFDPQGRFSLAEDDDARWLAGERPSPVAAAVDRDDELALVKATSEPDPEPSTPTVSDPRADLDSDFHLDADVEVTEELVAVLQVVPPVELSAEELAELAADDPESDGPEGRPQDAPEQDEDQHDEDDRDGPRRRDEAAEPTIAVVRQLTRVSVEVDGQPGDGPEAVEETRSALDTLYDMLGGDGYAEDSPRVWSGLSDAAAVPVVDEHEFEPPADVLVPAEPGPEPERETPADAHAAPVSRAADEPADEQDDQPGDAQDEDDAAPEDVDRPAAEAPPVPDVDEPLIPSPGASRKPGRRKRASVPSWDEIMFGGPKPG